MNSNQKIVPINIIDEMKSAYIDYSMSVIVSRALPDVRDGLKPVHRRVLFGMNELGLFYNKSHKKSARIVGEVLGKYHPHGDSSVYDTMVRMAQEWSLRYMLVDGQGNFGSVDGDSPAAMRYTEARLAKISNEMLADIQKNTVNFQYNFDDTLKEPTVLPTRIPNLLVNGASGIAVGMATNMLPHNLTEVVDGISAYVDNHDISIEELMQFIKAPDFPTGGTIYGLEGVKQAFETGRGRVVVRGKADVEHVDGRETIIVREIPYQVNKATMIQKIADLVNEKKIEGISDVRDESDRNGMRIVIPLKRDANASVVLSKLYKYSQLQSSFGVNNICLVDGRPRLLNLKELIVEFVKFRLEVIVRRTEFDKEKAEARQHILKGLLAALDRLDEIISLIRASKTGDEAKEALMAFDFTPKGDALDSFLGEFPLNDNHLDEKQARAILDMRLQRLTGLEREKLQSEFMDLVALIEDLEEILKNEARRKSIVKEELAEVKEKYGDERRTDITFAAGEISIEDMIKNEREVVTISHLGYIKRTPAAEYRAQSRGGRGAKAAKTRDKDFIEHILICNTHDYLLLFTQLGRLYWLRVYEIPEGGKDTKGRAIQNLIQIPENDQIKAYIPIQDLKDEEFLKTHNLIFATRKGIVKKTDVTAYSRVRTGGINAISFKEGDELLEVKLTNGNSEILLASRSGKAIRFHESDVRIMGRTATGVKGMTLANEDDELVGMVCINEGEEKQILVVSENGIGKRTVLEEYRQQTRGGKGIKTINITSKTGQLITIKAVTDDDDFMIINKSGLTIRIAAKELPTSGRATQGVKLMNLKNNDSIADVALIVNGQHEEEEEELEEGEELENQDGDASSDEEDTSIDE
jgi:DNA gyrase subunit A